MFCTAASTGCICIGQYIQPTVSLRHTRRTLLDLAYHRVLTRYTDIDVGVAPDVRMHMFLAWMWANLHRKCEFYL